MATSQEHAFLRYAMGAGFITEPMAQLCLRALDAADANGRAVTAAELSLELGLVQPGSARIALDALRAAGSPTPLARPSAAPPPTPGAPPPMPGAPPRPMPLPGR